MFVLLCSAVLSWCQYRGLKAACIVCYYSQSEYLESVKALASISIVQETFDLVKVKHCLRLSACTDKFATLPLISVLHFEYLLFIFMSNQNTIFLTCSTSMATHVHVGCSLIKLFCICCRTNFQLIQKS